MNTGSHPGEQQSAPIGGLRSVKVGGDSVARAPSAVRL